MPASGPADRVGGWRPEMRGSRVKGPGITGIRTARESRPAGRDAGRSGPRRLLGGGRRGQGLAAQAARGVLTARELRVMSILLMT
jgi:hypothetical protein